MENKKHYRKHMKHSKKIQHVELEEKEIAQNQYWKKIDQNLAKLTKETKPQIQIPL